MKYQARLQRAQWKMQRRSLRRRSVVGPLVLILLGILFLLAEAGRLPWGHLVDWYARWWPLVLIGAGLILLAEWAMDHARRDDEGRPMPGRSLGAGVVVLLMFMAAIGISLRFSDTGLEWKNRWLGPGWTGLAQAVGDEHDFDTSSDHQIAGSGALLIRNPNGDVTVTGTSTDGEIHISTHKHVWAWQDSDANSRAQELEPVVTGDNSHLTLRVAAINAGQCDISIEAPESTAVTIEAQHGSVNVSGMRANTEMTSNHGNVDVGDMHGTVTVHMNNDDSSLSAHDVTGPVSLEGHAGDITLTDIGGTVSLQGDFFGSTHAERIRGALRFTTSRTSFEAQRVDGSFEVSGDDLEGHEILGPIVLKTRNRNITLERVQGSVDVTNRNGDVNITQAKPLASVLVNNAHGSVNVGLPEGQGFSLDATTQHGDLENDFDLNAQETGDQKTVRSEVAGGGPNVTLKTSDGDVTIRKSSVDPLPPVPPAPPMGNHLAPPEPPAKPVPVAPKPPGAPKTPNAVNF